MPQSLFSFSLHNMKPVRKETFLQTMNKIVPWKELCELIDSKITVRKRGRRRLPTELLLRCICLQIWHGLSDDAAENDINDRASFQRFLGLDSFNESAPDHTTICKFRNFLMQEGLDDTIFSEINRILDERGMTLRQGTAVDATIINAPSSTKNKDGKRDPEMSSTKKGNNYEFGMKIHAGTDIGTAVVRTFEVSTAKTGDGKVFETLVKGDEGYVTGDRAYDSRKNTKLLRGRGIKCGIVRKKPKKQNLSGSLRKRNKKNSSYRAWAEMPFNVVKRLWKQDRVRFRGLAKNKAWFKLCFAFSNLYVVRKRLLADA